MTDKQRLAKVDKASTNLFKWLGVLQQYKLTMEFHDDLGEGHRRGAVATVEEQYPYRLIEIACRRDWVDRSTLVQIEETMLHEVLHVLLFCDLERYVVSQGLERGGAYTDIEEHAVDLATHYISRLRPARGFKA